MTGVKLKKLNTNHQSIQLVFRFIKSLSKDYISDWSTKNITINDIYKLHENGVLFAIMYNNIMIGFIGYRLKHKYFISEFNEKYWIHYVISEEYKGQGITTKAVKLLLEQIRDIDSLYAGVNILNLASIAVLKKCGFKKVFKTNNIYIFSLSI